jgi:toxin ParE1/3/4
MPDLTLTPLAREDLKNIGRYTQREWGVTQRDLYLGAFATVFDALCDGTAVVHTRDEIRENLRACLCNKHVIFFHYAETGDVQVLRILHERMDFARHL